MLLQLIFKLMVTWGVSLVTIVVKVILVEAARK